MRNVISMLGVAAALTVSGLALAEDAPSGEAPSAPMHEQHQMADLDSMDLTPTPCMGMERADKMTCLQENHAETYTKAQTNCADKAEGQAKMICMTNTFAEDGIRLMPPKDGAGMPESADGATRDKPMSKPDSAEGATREKPATKPDSSEGATRKK